MTADPDGVARRLRFTRWPSSRDFGLSDLERCAALSDGWRRRNLATPLLLTPDEFARALDAFPLEYR